MIKKIYREQILNCNLDEAWNFFATPKNLNAITPADMHFKILSSLPEEMYAGLIIEYKIKPFLNIPLYWCTEITHVKKYEYFIDEQRQGPYKMWHHEHHFSQHHKGVLMKDILHYDIGKSIIGDLAGALFVHKKVKQIFDFRFQKLEEVFNQG